MSGVFFGFYLANGINDDSLLVNYIGGAEGAHGHLAVVFLLAPCLVSLKYFAIGVGDEMKGQLVLGDETLVRSCRVLAHTQHLISEVEETVIIVAQVAGLGGAAGGAVLGVEIED